MNAEAKGFQQRDDLYSARRDRAAMNRNSMSSISSTSRPPLSPSDSCVSLGSFRPSLVWLFNHIRHEDRENLSKDDLCHLLGTNIDSGQLDEAFERLDLDGDGQISLEEFIAGFATFWKEAPHTPAPQDKGVFGFPGARRMIEEHYESSKYASHDSREGSHDTEEAPTPEFQGALNVLSSHNRHSIENLWRSIREANPELLADFEDFVGEVAEEVEVAQRALDNQRRATKKEARELDVEIESRLSDARTTLQIQTALVKQQVQTRLEERLVEKEAELLAVKGQLNELETEIVNKHSQLEKQCQELNKEKEELKGRLQVSEKKLESTQTTMESLQSQAEKEVAIQETRMQEQEKELLQHKAQYEEEIIRLKEQLDHYKKHGNLDESPPPREYPVEAQPDLLATTRLQPSRTSKNSLMDEIVQKEGVACPVLRGEQLLEPSPFSHGRSGSFVARRRKKAPSNLQQSRSELTMSLPNLLDIDKMEDPPPANRHSVFIPIYVGASGLEGAQDDDGFYDNRDDDVPVPRADSPESSKRDHMTSNEENVITQSDLVTSSNVPVGDDDIESNPDHPLQEESWESQFLRLCQPLEFIEALATQPDYVFKILVVGNSYVGKSSFLMRLCTNAFSPRYSSTIGVDFYSKALRLDDKVVSLQLWDTAGQERFQSVTKAYYRGAQGVILMYDIGQEESFIAVKSWMNAIQDNVEEMPAGLLLVGNKVDLDEQGEREVSVETGETFAKIYGADFIEASAKTGYNVGAALLKLVSAVKLHYEQSGGNTSPRRRTSTKVSPMTQEPSNSKCCGSR